MFRLAAILALAATHVLAAPLDLPVRAPSGSAWLIEARYTREKTSSTGSSTSYGSSRYRAELSGEGGARRLIVTPQPVTAGQAPAPFAIEFAVDGALTPKQVLNWAQIQRMSIEAAEKSGLSAKMIDQAKAMYADTSAEAAASMLVGVLPWIAEGQDTNLELGRPSPSKDSAGSHGSVGLEVAFTLVSIDAAAGRAVVSAQFRQAPAPVTEELRAQFRQMVESTNPKASKELPELTGELSRACRYEIDVATGLAVRTECDTVGWNLFVNGGGSGMERQTEHWIITQTLQARP